MWEKASIAAAALVVDLWAERRRKIGHWLKENASATEPPIELLDTTDAGEAETAVAVARWIREKAVLAGETD
jgi:hypothetical protein